MDRELYVWFTENNSCLEVQSHLHCSENFHGWNAVISIGINAIRNFVWRWKISPCRFHNVGCIDRQNAVWFETDFSVSCASYSTLLTIFFWRLAEISVMWMHLNSWDWRLALRPCITVPFHPSLAQLNAISLPLSLHTYIGRSYLLLRGQIWLCQTQMHAGWKLCSPVFGRPRISWGGIKHAQGCLWTTVSASAVLFFSLSLSPSLPQLHQ